MNLRKKSGIAAAGVGLIASIALVAVGPVPMSQAGGQCNEGETTFLFDLPDGVTIKPTKGAVKRGPSKVKMANCGGNFDVETGSGGVDLIGGVNFKFEGDRGPTGEYRLRYGGVGKVRAKVVGKAANIAKIVKGDEESSGGSFHAFGDLKLTTKGANLLNGAVGSDSGPWKAGNIGTVDSRIPLSN